MRALYPNRRVPRRLRSTRESVALPPATLACASPVCEHPCGGIRRNRGDLVEYLGWLVEIARATGESMATSYADWNTWSPLHWVSVIVLGGLACSHRRAAVGYVALVGYSWALRLAAADLDIYDLHSSEVGWIRFALLVLVGAVGSIGLYNALFIRSLDNRGWGKGGDDSFRDLGERGLTRRRR